MKWSLGDRLGPKWIHEDFLPKYGLELKNIQSESEKLKEVEQEGCWLMFINVKINMELSNNIVV